MGGDLVSEAEVACRRSTRKLYTSHHCRATLRPASLLVPAIRRELVARDAGQINRQPRDPWGAPAPGADLSSPILYTRISSALEAGSQLLHPVRKNLTNCTLYDRPSILIM